MDTPPGRASAMELSRLLGILLGLLLPYVSPRHDRVIGGWICPEDKHPSLVELYNFTFPFCAGVLIDLSWVVTAAHCCKKSGAIVIKLGAHNLSQPSGHEQMRSSAKTILFNSSSDCETECKDDIMLIKLNTPAIQTAYVAPIDLATTCAPVGTECIACGWGAITSPNETYPDEPYCVNITVVEKQLCKNNFPCIVSDNIVCAGDLEGGKDSCRGDSGGPLICNNALQGIVSLGGDPCAQPNLPGVYTSICRYYSWIQEKIGGSSNGSKS